LRSAYGGGRKAIVIKLTPGKNFQFL